MLPLYLPLHERAAPAVAKASAASPPSAALALRAAATTAIGAGLRWRGADARHAVTAAATAASATSYHGPANAAAGPAAYRRVSVAAAS